MFNHHFIVDFYISQVHFPMINVIVSTRKLLFSFVYTDDNKENILSNNPNIPVVPS